MKKGLLGVSLITLGCLWGLVAAIFIAVSIIAGFPIYIAILVSMFIVLIQFLIAPFFTDLTMKWFYGAKFNLQMPDYFVNFVNETCKRHNMKYPKIGYINDGAPNAFTYGRTKNDARIIVTRGLFELLTEEEVKSVVAHEIGHAAHYDMAFMTVAQLVPLLLYYVYEICAGSNNKKSNSNSSKGSKLEVVGYIAYVLYIIAQYIILWLSRTREYAADQFSVEETRNPSALASALVKIGFGLSTSSSENIVDGKKKASASKSNALGIFDSKTSKSLAISCSSDANGVNKDSIKNAMKWEMWNPWAIYFEIQSTHPLISKRLLAISSMCPAYNQEPYIVFDLQKTESYVDDFIGELLLRELPAFLSIVCIIVFAIISALEKTNLIVIPAAILFIASIVSYIKLNRRYKNKDYNPTTVSNLLGEVKVSDVTAIPCTLTGKIIGRGNPGCIFNEDFVIKDSTGIIFLDYNQPVRLLNKIFALFKSPEYFDKDIVVKGWYRRSPVPYVEIKSMIIDGKEKKCYTYGFAKFARWVYMIIAAGCLALSIFMMI